jgi:hypothetical protein
MGCGIMQQSLPKQHRLLFAWLASAGVGMGLPMQYATLNDEASHVSMC